jgi:endonuclease/exonuclease/phosphatase family metal-dependent hydrolase
MQTFRPETPEEIYRAIRERIQPHLRVLAQCRSEKELGAHPVYRSLETVIQTVLETPEIADYRARPAPAKSRYRFLAWNIERGAEIEGQIRAFREHPYLSRCDVLLLTETDIGMARSGNHHVAQTLARELDLAYVFVPTYLNLTKGSGAEFDLPGDNEIGLHGDAILSRYPVRNPRGIPMSNGMDKIAGREQRIGRPTAVAADIDFPGYPITAVAVHLDAQSSQRHRHGQMRDVLDRLDTPLPVVLGGDWNTSTYNSTSALPAIAGFWLRVFMGVDHVIRNHYLDPGRLFERELFDLLESRGFDFRDCNVPGEYTVGYDVENARTRKSLGDWVPGWCFAFIRWALRNHGGKCPLKLDWFATRGVRVESPAVIHDVREGLARPLSDHDAIGIDVVAP